MAWVNDEQKDAIENVTEKQIRSNLQQKKLKEEN